MSRRDRASVTTRYSVRFPWYYPIIWPYRFLFPLLPSSTTTTRLPLSTGADGSSSDGMLRLLVLGDLMPMKGEIPPTVDPAIRAVVERADLLLGNCESPLLRDSLGRRRSHRAMRHWMSERFLREYLLRLGASHHTTILSIANNHIADQGRDGLRETVDTLVGAGITVAGLHDMNASPVTIVKHKGITIGVAAWTEWLNRNPFTERDRVTLRSDILNRSWKDIRSAGTIDALVAYPHWDHEFRHEPLPSTRRLARATAELGFDLIAGCHAHVVQPLEHIGSSRVIYGLGSLNGPSSPARPRSLRLSFLFEALIAPEEPRVRRYTIHPVVQLGTGEGTRLVPLRSAPDPLRRTLGGILDAMFIMQAPRLSASSP